MTAGHPEDRDETGPVPPQRYEHPMPPDAARVGLDRNTEEGAMIALAGALNPRKASHRVVAWIMLLAIGLPVIYTIMVEIF